LDLSLDSPKVQEKNTTLDTDRLKQEDEATKKTTASSIKEEATMKPIEEVKLSVNPTLAKPSILNSPPSRTGQSEPQASAAPHPYSEENPMKSDLQEDVKIIQDIQKSQTPINT
jgi:hypothetical protein